MSGMDQDEVKLKQCLEQCIEVLRQKTPTQEVQDQPQQGGSTESPFINGILDTNIHSFTLDSNEESMMEQLKTDLEEVINIRLPSLNKQCRKYLLDFLHKHNYDDQKEQFTSPFNIGIIPSLENDLNSILASLRAFRAAFDGNQSEVEEYIKKYPKDKNSSGLWGTTLLYSAARNNHRNLVTYLVQQARCSVNAQNQQHIKRALSVPITANDDCLVNPTAGSTALHGACYYGHLEIVKYLVHRGADYFLKNHAEETPIMNALSQPKILQYFQDFLILGYSVTTNVLPAEPIIDYNEECVVDCIWEYKPFADQQWYKFSQYESTELQQSLIVTPGKEFKNEIHLKVPKGIYTVSLIQFLRSGKDTDYQQSVAWIRCRGSSIANFNCYALWEIMFTRHPTAESNPSLKMLCIPTIHDSGFKVQLNSWYFCDAKTDSQLEKTMRNRRKEVILTIPYISDEELKFDLQQFTFRNKNDTISGYLRWIPKMISNNERNKSKIIGINDFESTATRDLIPLTPSRLKQVSQNADTHSFTNNDDIDENITNHDDDDDDESFIDYTMSNDKNEESNQAPSTPNSVDTSFSEQLHTITNPFNNITGDTNECIQNSASSITQTSHMPTTTTTTDSDIFDGRPEESINDFINEQTAEVRTQQEPSLVEKPSTDNDTERLAAMSNELSELRQKNETLENNLRTEHLRLHSLLESNKQQSDENEQIVMSLFTHIEQMETEQERNRQEQERLQRLANNIKSIEYANIQREIVHNILTPKQTLILNYLRHNAGIIDPSFSDRVPRIVFKQYNHQYIVNIIGFPIHHDTFKSVLKRILSLFNIITSAKNFVQRDSNRFSRQLIKDTLFRVASQEQIWRQYVKIFRRILDEKLSECVKKFNDFIDEQFRSLIDPCILTKTAKPWIEIRNQTDSFMRKSPLTNEIESIKHKAFDEFINENILVQRVKLAKKPTNESVVVLTEFIDKVKKQFSQNKKFQGHTVQHFTHLAKLLQRLMIYYSSFKIQLPLFESSKDLLEKIENNTITTISTSTGSGKSTLLPALLIAEGYDKVIVTQPRRLPCQLICKRVNETMTTSGGSLKEPLAGWAVSGTEKNPQAKILYLTDGLLKERLLYDENFIGNHTQVNKYIVFFIDEVHERSVNIDLCLALCARLLTIKPELKSKMKLIISSATLDTSVPNLFRHIPNAGLAEFQMPQMGTLYPVQQIARPNENVLDIVQELCKKRRRHDQILCFVSSVSDVNQCCKLIHEISHGTITAHPLIQSQHPNVQQENIEHGTIFFSTTIAETSLTFPCLKYVVDTGMINTPVYDFQSKRTVLKEIRAAQSTIKQRLGRLGRTQSGEYYSLYDFKVEDVKYPIPQICQSDLMNIEFSLRKSPLKQGFQYMKQFLPDRPSQNAIDTIIHRLIQLNILEATSNDKFTKHGINLSKLPDFGSLAMSKAVLAALCEYKCGHDLICLSAILGVLNTTIIFKSIPQHLKSSDGDFMTLLNIMNEILLVKQSVASNQFDINHVCSNKGLTSIQHIIRQALRRYTTLENTFNQSADYRAAAQVQSGNWEMVAKSLLQGYDDNVFVSLKELQGCSHKFIRYNDKGDIAILDLQSTLTRPIIEAPVAFALARDIRYSTAVREKAIISFVGEIKPKWVEHQIQRQFDLNDIEENHLNTADRYAAAVKLFSHSINIQLSNKMITLKGSAGIVLNAELHLRQLLVSEMKFSLGTLAQGTTHENFTHNLESVMKMIYIFKPMVSRWRAQRQVEISINSNTATKICEITVKGRISDNQLVKKEFDSFIRWLQPCAVIRHPTSGISPRVLRRQMRKSCQAVEERIARVTDSKRTPIDLYNDSKSKKATRETRMEVVAWIAICKYDCKLEGGFVRDWIIDGNAKRPANLLTNPKAWIQYNNNGIPYLNKEVIPCDLDCHLSSHVFFDIDKFEDDLYKYGISCKVFREDWRYVLLLDENATTGPFTMDLIEPHIALTHDRIDFDVSNLLLEKDYTHEIGMRIDVQKAPYSIELETIVDNIKNKRFRVLRPKDYSVNERINRMIIRGWTETGTVLSVIPEPHFKHYVILVPLPKSTPLYTDITGRMQNIGAIRILSIEEVKNPYLEETYGGMKKIIAKQCAQQNPNEQELFHGTDGDGITGIAEDGFDDRFFNKDGLYGHGAYFADDPKKSHVYAAADSNKRHVMYYSKVILGNPEVLTATDKTLVSARPGFHSIVGKHSNLTEYIVYRYGQALPYLKIVYTA